MANKSVREISLDMDSGFNNALGWDRPTTYRPIRKMAMPIYPLSLVSGYGFYNSNNDDKVDEQPDVDVQGLLNNSNSTGSNSVNDCNFIQRVLGRCKTDDGITAKMKKCKAMYPNDYEAYKKCLQGKGQGWTFLESLVGSLGLGNQAVSQNQAASSNFNADDFNKPEKKGIGAAGWIAIVAVGGFLAVMAMRKK